MHQKSNLVSSKESLWLLQTSVEQGEDWADN